MNKMKSKFGSKLPALALDSLSSSSESRLAPTDCNHVWGPLYISDYSTAQNKQFLLREGFTHIIVCSASCSSLYQDAFTYFRVDLKDRVSETLFHAITNFIQFVEHLPSHNVKILVHCKEGRSRAPMVLSGYLVWKLGISFEEALAIVRTNRPKIDPNFGFMLEGSQAFEQTLSNISLPETCHLLSDKLMHSELRKEADMTDKIDIRSETGVLQTKFSHVGLRRNQLIRNRNQILRRTHALSGFKPKKVKNQLLERVKRRMQWKRSTSSTSTSVSEASPRHASFSW